MSSAVNKPSWWLVAQTLHKWLGLIVGLQLLIWLATGLAFNLIDEQKLDADVYRISDTPAAIATQLAKPDTLVAKYQSQGFIQLKLVSVLNRPVYAISTQTQDYWFWGDSLEPMLLTLEQLTQIAQASYSGSGTMSTARPLTNATAFVAQGPVVQIETSDEIGTRIYLDSASGRVLAHQNRQSDLKDLLFMLHFMDYVPENGINFNHALVQIISLGALLLGMSGVFILGHKFSQGQLRLPRLKPSTSQGKIHLYSEQAELLSELPIHTGTLLHSLNQGQERLRTNCGGGGRCGLCKLRFIEQAPAPNDYDLDRLSVSELESGVRLSCQHPAQPCKLTLVTKAQHRFLLNSTNRQTN